MVSNREPYAFTALEAARALAQKSLSPTELVASTFDRIEEVEPRVGAFCLLDKERALADAEQATAEIAHGHRRGPLHGLTVSIKDLFNWSGTPTRAGSAATDDRPVNEDAEVVRRLRASGAIIIGKTHTHEFAWGATTPSTRNPWDLERSPGGSSGGSGAAIAAGMGVLSLGTDTAGSIRVPSSWCGVVGFKPTYGLISTRGLFPLSWSLDHVGPLARTVEDVAMCFDIIADLDPGATPTALDLEGSLDGLRIGIPRDQFIGLCDAEVAEAFDVSIAVLRDAGAILAPLDLPQASAFRDVGITIMSAEAASVHRDLLRERGDLYTPSVRNRLEAGALQPATTYIDAQRLRTQMKAEWKIALEGLDAVAMPTTPVTAVPRGCETRTYDDGRTEPIGVALTRFDFAANLLGLPALSVPCTTRGGMPVGLQILGRPYDDRRVLRLGHAYQRATGQHPYAPLAPCT